MKKFALWILSIFVLNRVLHIGWHLPGIVLFDIFSAVAIGILIGGIQHQLRMTQGKFLRILMVSMIFGLLAEPVVIHYEITMTLLEKTLGTHPSAITIYWEGFLRSIVRLLMAISLFFLTIQGASYLLDVKKS